MGQFLQKRALVIILVALLAVFTASGWFIFTKSNLLQKKLPQKSSPVVSAATPSVTPAVTPSSAAPSTLSTTSAYYILSKRKLSPTPTPTPKPAAPRQTSVAKIPAKSPAQGSSNNQPKSPGIPVWFSIPKLGVQASVESIGLDAAGKMDVPKNPWNVGWYNLGYRIGDVGSAVISGHLDSSTGVPTVFYNLSKLVAGDLITVKVDNGSVYTYKVVNKQFYPYDQLPLQQIFASSGKVQLNLITCGGVWSRANNNYTQRTVIFSELAN